MVLTYKRTAVRCLAATAFSCKSLRFCSPQLVLDPTETCLDVFQCLQDVHVDNVLDFVALNIILPFMLDHMAFTAALT